MPGASSSCIKGIRGILTEVGMMLVRTDNSFLKAFMSETGCVGKGPEKMIRSGCRVRGLE